MLDTHTHTVLADTHKSSQTTILQLTLLIKVTCVICVVSWHSTSSCTTIAAAVAESVIQQLYEVREVFHGVNTWHWGLGSNTDAAGDTWRSGGGG